MIQFTFNIKILASKKPVHLLTIFAMFFCLPLIAERMSPSAGELFDHPGRHAPRELYKLSHKAFSRGDIDDARLLALRLFFDGYRSSNLLGLLGAIEIKAGQSVLAGEWLRKSLCLSGKQSTARKLLAQLPPEPRPIPINPDQLREHFNAVTKTVPKLLGRLSTPELHSKSVFSAIQRGQFYLALALAEEYEKRFPGLEGQAQTAICAFYLCRLKDASALCVKGLSQSPHHPLLLSIKAFLSDTNPETSASCRARALYDLDRWEEAIESANQMNELDSRSCEGFLLKARISLDQQRLQETTAFLDEAEKRDPDHPKLHLLRVDLFSRLHLPEEAGKSLERAFRRGYHLPSVNLEAALIAAAQGKTEDSEAILEDAENSEPFLDRDAYQMFIMLSLMINQLPRARNILDKWEARVPINSIMCFMEAIYQHKAGDGRAAIEWIRKGFKMNPNNVVHLTSLAKIAESLGDSTLSNQILSHLASIRQEPARIVQSSVSEQATSESPQYAANDFGKFRLQVVQGVAPEVVGAIQGALGAALQKIESKLGLQIQPINAKIVHGAELPENVALYDFSNDCLNISTIFCDPQYIRGLVESKYPNADSEQQDLLVSEWPTHQLTHEMAHAAICQIVEDAAKGFSQNAWMHEGLAEILGGEASVIRNRLLIAHQNIASGTGELVPPEELNKIFSDPIALKNNLEVALAEAYLMAAFLIKKESPFSTGLQKMLKLIELVGKGKTLDKALFTNFKIGQPEFYSGWKTAAYWSLKQGVPYEW